MSNPIIETDLAQILTQIDRKLEKLTDDVADLKVGQAELKIKVENIDLTTKELKEAQKTLVTDVADLKGSKSLIVPIVVAVITSILTLLVRAIPIN